MTTTRTNDTGSTSITTEGPAGSTASLLIVGSTIIGVGLDGAGHASGASATTVDGASMPVDVALAALVQGF